MLQLIKLNNKKKFVVRRKRDNFFLFKTRMVEIPLGKVYPNFQQKQEMNKFKVSLTSVKEARKTLKLRDSKTALPCLLSFMLLMLLRVIRDVV